MPGTVAHVVGARPNFMKAAPVIRALAARGIEQRVIHTGQHYDATMSDVFFADLGLPEPDLNLGVGSGSQAGQTAALLVALEGAFAEVQPSLAIVYGDINSTLAAALVAAKTRLPIAHVEAGLRSFDDTMPEEVNRRVTDLLSDLLFVTSPEGLTNLERMGVPADRIHFVGNPMIDTLLANLDRFDAARIARPARPGRTLCGCDDAPAGERRRPGRGGAGRRDAPRCRGPGAARRCPSTLAGGPCSRRQVSCQSDRLRIIEPLGYVDFLSLVRGSALVVTDSGGIQEETTVLGVPCLTVRPNTERPITITHGTNRLVEPEGVVALAAAILDDGLTPAEAAPAVGRPRRRADRGCRPALAGFLMLTLVIATALILLAGAIMVAHPRLEAQWHTARGRTAGTGDDRPTIGIAGLAVRSFAPATLLLIAVAWLVLAGLIAWQRRQTPVRWRARSMRAISIARATLRDPAVAIATLLVVGTLVWRTILAVRLPVVDYDGWSYHLVFVDVWLQNDACPNARAASTMDLGIPRRHGDAHDLVAAFTHSDVLTGFSSLVPIPVGILATMGLARSIGSDRRAAVLAGLLFGMTPALVALAGTSYVDAASVAMWSPRGGSLRPPR